MTFDLDYFKKQYEILSKKYELPEFKVLNDDFELERINQESTVILRSVRKAMMDKILNTLLFLEMLLNPVNASRVYMPYIRVMTGDDHKLIEKIYTTLGKVSLRGLLLEVEYNEKNEAAAIKEIYTTWKDMKPSLKLLVQKVASPVAASNRRGHNYFG